MADSSPTDVSDLSLPLMPLRDMVVFPHMVIPLFVGRALGIKALEAALASDRRVMLLAQKAAAKDDPEASDLFEIGCVATILQMLKLPDGTVKVLVEGQMRAKLGQLQQADGYSVATVTPLVSDPASLTAHQTKEIEALRRAVVQEFDQYVKLHKKIPQEIVQSISQIDSASRLADTVAAHLPLKLEQKQAILDVAELRVRLEALYAQLQREVDLLNVDKRIRGRVKRQMEKNQRDFYLNEQVKAIQKELGDGEDGAAIEELEGRLKSAKLPKEAQKKAEAEIKKLKLMSPMSAEATVVRTYLDVLAGLPWAKKSKIKHNLAHAETVLNQDHHGLEKVKDRILEYLAVQQRVEKVKAPILCLVGPPGVGKTSLGQSIAKATGRKYVRMALGGVRDEAEIRGHRRTYIGALPGKVLQSLQKVEVRNPLFLLDEIDKMGTDFRGDPASALLEVLDPEQNHTFQDHYVEVNFDLSEVMFVATSNSMNIPPALLDRMEVIRLSGYTEDEKLAIAKQHLLPKQLVANGIKPGELDVGEDALRDVVRYYTRESGVRALEREISKICRKVVKSLLLKQTKAPVHVGADELATYLGVQKFKFGLADSQDQVGQVVGLAWTEVGGDLLTIEAAAMPGKGLIHRTGSLGDVMKESVDAARTVVRSRSVQLGIADDAFEKRDIHIHVPDGATPKDGPSAGVAMTTAIVSVLTGIPVKASVAMTGEITLRGEVTAIGGLKEKLLAALRGGVTTALIPQDNVKDLVDIPDNVKNGIEIVPVKWIDEVLAHALARLPMVSTQAATDTAPAASTGVASPTSLNVVSTPASIKH